jgi:hypothetical protein
LPLLARRSTPSPASYRSSARKTAKGSSERGRRPQKDSAAALHFLRVSQLVCAGDRCGRQTSRHSVVASRGPHSRRQTVTRHSKTTCTRRSEPESGRLELSIEKRLTNRRQVPCMAPASSGRSLCSSISSRTDPLEHLLRAGKPTAAKHWLPGRARPTTRFAHGSWLVARPIREMTAARDRCPPPLHRSAGLAPSTGPLLRGGRALSRPRWQTV